MKQFLQTLAFAFWAVEAAASPFQDLNFDAANTNNLRDFGGGVRFGSSADLLPGWQLFSEAHEIATIGFNNLSSGFSPTYGEAILQDASLAPALGTYALQLIPALTAEPAQLPMSLTQTGDIPVNAKSIHYLTFDNLIDLSINGSKATLSLHPVPNSNPNLKLVNVSADVSGFAGQTVKLTFSPALGPNRPFFGIDEIYFSSEVLPEPSVLAFSALGVLLLGGHCCRARIASRSFQKSG